MFKTISIIFWDREEKHPISLPKFGEMCVITYCNKTHQAKLANHGTTGIWLGYVGEHPVGTFQVMSSKTRKINLTCDVTFLKKSYGEFKEVDNPVIIPMSYEGLDDEDNDESNFLNERNNDNGCNVVVMIQSMRARKRFFEQEEENLFEQDSKEEFEVI